jgi:hypothetical protein
VGGILVARFIGPEINGQFRLFTIPLMYLTFLHLGTFDGLHRQIPFFIGRQQSDHVKKLPPPLVLGTYLSRLSFHSVFCSGLYGIFGKVIIIMRLAGFPKYL